MICPNLSDNKVRAEFTNLTNLVGEDFAYFVWNRNGGYPLDKKVVTVKGKETVIDNPLYNHFLGSYNNVKQATLATSIYYSKKLQKSNPGFDNLPIQEQANIIHDFVQENETLEKASERVMRFIAQGFKAERVLDESIRRVAFDEARKIANGRQLLDSYVWFKTSPLSLFVDFANMQNKEESSFATWTKSAITLYKGSDYSDLYHEGWHEFTQRFMTKEQRIALYQSVKSRPSTALINGVQVPYYALTSRQIEEVLAEEFRSFSLNKSNPEVVVPRIEAPVRNLFQKIWDFLTSIFNASPQEIASRPAEEVQDGITALFEKLYAGKIYEYTPSVTNISEKVLNRNKSFQINYVAKDGRTIPFEYNALEAAEIFSAIDFFLSKAMDDFKTSDGTKIKLEMSFLLNKDLKQVYLPQLYESARNSMLQYITALEEEATTADEATAEVLKLRVKNLKGLVVRTAANDGWATVVENHQRASKGGVFYLEENKKSYDVDNRIDDQDESELRRDSRSFANAEDVDPMSLASPEILQLIKILPGTYYNSLGEMVTATGPSFGLPQSGDFLRNKNLVLSKVSGSISYEEAIQRLENTLDIAPQLRQLIDRLPPADTSLSLSQLALKAQFMQFAAMPTVYPYEIKSLVQNELSAVTKKKEKRLETKAFLNNTLSQDKLIEFFDQDFVSNRLRKYRLIDPKEIDLAVYDRASVLSDYRAYTENGFTSDQVAFEFLNDAFGINLIADKNPNLLFNKRGELQLGVNPIFTTTNLRNLVKIANNALFKLKLLSLIDSSEENLNTPTIAYNPLLALSSDISKQLKEQIKELKSGEKNKVIKEYFEKHFKAATLDNERTSAFSTIEKLYNISNSASYLNPEGNLEYAVREWNHLLDSASKINNVKNIYELGGHLNPESNNFLEYSLIMNAMFRKDDGTRRTTNSGEGVYLEILNMSGFTIGKTRGDKTTNLSGDGKLLQDFLSFIQDATIENMRVGAKSSSFATRLSGNRGEREYFKYDQYQFKNQAVVSSDFIRQMQNYLNFEAMRMFDDRAKSTRKERAGSEFIILDTILPQEIKDKVKEAINEAPNKEALKLTLRGMFGLSANSLYGPFKDAVTAYFKSSADVLKVSFNEILSKGESKNLAKEFYRIHKKQDGTAYTSEEIDSVLLYFTTNYFAHQVEVMHLLIGDPSNYKIKNNEWREAFKRLGPAISPGKQPRFDLQDINSWNTTPSLSRGLEEVQRGKGKGRPYDTNLNYVQYEDIKTFEYLEESTKNSIKESIRQNYLDALVAAKGPLSPEELARESAQIDSNTDAVLVQDEEANAQAYAGLDFIRYYLNSIGEWLPELEEAYRHEVKVLQAIKDYRQSNSNEDLAKVKELVRQSNLGILTSLKLGYYGSPTDYNKYNVLGKYSVFPLSPSMVFDTDLENLMFDYLDKGVDMSTFSSGNKMSLPVNEMAFYNSVELNGKKIPVPSANGALELTKVDPNLIVRLPIDGLRRQQYIAPKFKGEATLSTQMVKLIFSNFFVSGKINPKYAHIQDKIEALQEAFINNIKTIVEVEKAKIYSKIGATVNAEGKLTSINTKDFTNWLHREFDKKEVPSSVYDFIRPSNNNQFVFSLDAGVQRSLIDQIISSALSKRVLKPKMFGEAYIQLASSGFNKLGTRKQKPTVDEIKTISKEFNVSGLRDYRIEDGVTQPADVLIPFNAKKHAPLLNLVWNGEVIGTLDRLNDALDDPQWVKTHSAKITLVGVRIPVQGLNSMEYFRVRRFLATVGGPVMVVPPSIVTKSGSDFDIDKLFMYEPELDENGELIVNAELASAEYRSKIIENILDKNTYLKGKALLLDNLFDSESFREAGLVSQEIDSIKKMISDLKGIKTSGEEDDIAYFKENIGPLNMKLGIAIERFKTLRNQDPNVVQFLENLAQYKEVLSEMENISEKLIKGSASNNMISVISGVLSEASIYSEFTKPNVNKILPEIAREYQALKGRDSKIDSSAMFLIETSIRIFTENNLGKKSLGVDAKTNALHKLFQQVGLRFASNPQNIDINSFYLLKSNKNPDTGEIELGGLYDADGVNLISDVINEFINGHVDIEKEDWINFFNADRERTPLILQMVLNGTPVKDAILLVNQPIIQHYIRSSKITKVGKALGQKSASLFKDYITPAMNYLDITPVTVDGLVDEAATIEKVLSMPSINKALSAKNFNKENFAPNPYVRRFAYDKIKANRNTPEGQSALEAQLAFAAQYYVVKEQNKILLELTSNIDFNTSSYRINTEFYATTQNIKVAAPNFAAEGFNRILESSVVAPFNILEDTEKLIDQVWDFFSLEEIKEHLYNVKESYGKYWGRDESVTNYNQLVNSFMLSFIQNIPSLKSFQDNYGISSGLFDLKSANNLRTRFDKLFSSTEDKALKRFAENNLILNNFSPISIPDSNYFYPGMITNEKDVDTVNAAQKAFSDGLNHPNPEVSKFFRDLANGVLVSQGFNIKYRSIQNFIPLEAKSDLMIELSIALKKIKIGLSKPVEEMTEKDSEDAAAFMSLLESTTSMHANLYWPSKDNDFIPTAYMKAFPNFKEEEAKAVTTEKKNSRVTNQDDLDEAKLYAQQFDNDVPSMDELDEEQLITRRLVAKGKTVPAKSPTMVTDKIIPLSASQRFTRSSVEKDSDYMYLFTDNAKRTSGSNLIPDESRYSAVYGQGNKYPTTTQAVVRGLDNAFPITTMVDDKKTQWTDDRFEEFKKEIDSEIEIIKGSISYFKGIKFSGEMPFGKGAISNMKETAPKSWAYLNSKLAEIGIDNTGKMPIPTQPSTSVDNTSKPVFNSLPNKSSVLTMTYAGIGSRQTPSEVLKQMTEIAKQLESKGYTLNTGITFRGKEEGADKAFSDGTTKKNLFSPEKQGARAKEQTIAKEMHPNPGALSGGGLKLMARNTNQVFGDNLDKPVDFVLFYAKETSNSLRPEGGTGQAVEMARRKGIPTINMADINWKDQLKMAIATQPSTTNNLEGFDFEVTKCIID